MLGGYTFADENNRNVWEADRSNFQPRVGLSYQLNEKTVLRTGFGIFMAPFMIETPQQIGFAGTTPVVPSNNNGLTFVATLTNPFPAGLAGVQPSFGSSLGLLTGIGADVASSDVPIIGVLRKNAKFARYVVGIQRELPGQMVVEANFIHADGYNLAVSRNLNFVPAQFLGDDPTTDTASNTFLSAKIPNPFRNLVPGGSPFNTATNITRAQSLLAFPQFTNLWVQEYNGTNRYNSLQVQIDKRFATDMTLTATYTYSNLREKVELPESERHRSRGSHLAIRSAASLYVRGRLSIARSAADARSATT